MLIYPERSLVFEVGYHPCTKIHIIRVVLQDQARYVRTSWHMSHETVKGEKKKKHSKTCIQGLFSYLKNMCLWCVLKILLRCWLSIRDQETRNLACCPPPILVHGRSYIVTDDVLSQKIELTIAYRDQEWIQEIWRNFLARTIYTKWQQFDYDDDLPHITSRICSCMDQTWIASEIMSCASFSFSCITCKK